MVQTGQTPVILIGSNQYDRWVNDVQLVAFRLIDQGFFSYSGSTYLLSFLQSIKKTLYIDTCKKFATIRR